ncbi:hypothetical protein ABZ721_33050 [Streptomyces sp. NPDC006733]|uniref:hypothetical protein n=1 Tax=Streptomyces sp. NPDC006733 TaxID=3155460 RepID=UPI00340D17AD
MTTPDAPPVDSYAPPARRRAFVQAMEQLVAERAPGAPVRVYVSTPPTVLSRPHWDRRFAAVRDSLPHGVDLLYYATAFPSDVDLAEAWPPFATTLDGLVVIGKRNKPGGMGPTLILGPVARIELRTVVAAGKPVLLHTMEHGLVPVLDCKPRRTGTVEGRQRLKLTIPGAWDPQAPTLTAALAALRPAESTNPAAQDVSTPEHLAHPFTTSR